MTTSSTGDAVRYARIRRRLLLADLVGEFAFLGFFQLSGLSTAAALWAASTADSWPVELALYLTVFAVLSYLVFLPLHLYASFFLEHQFGLSRMTAKDWLIREAKSVTLAAAFGLALMEGWYALLHAAPRWWPLFATIGWLTISVVIARIFPTVLVPLFYKTVPIEDAALVRRLTALCKKAKLNILGVFRVDLGKETRKANAALAGLGGTRRVMISDTLLNSFSPEEIETVLAHEVGHHHYRHITQFVVLSAAGSFLAFSLVRWASNWWVPRFGFDGLYDPSGFPILMLALAVIGLIGLPIQNGISRIFEWQADRFAITLTRMPNALAGALRKLAELNLSDPNPPRWVEVLFYDHPPTYKRIEAAEAAKI